MTCGFSHLDGSYVLGALSPAERQEFEAHLAQCAECSRSVRELAGLPGLLARVTPEMLAAPELDDVPETLLPSLVHEVRRTRRRQALVVAGVAAATLVAVALGALAAGGALDADPTGTPAAGGSASLTSDVGASPGASPSEEMLPVGHVPVRASLTHEDVGWGTRLALTCTYASDDGYAEPRWESYSLVVRTRDGAAEQVASWRALPGRTMTLDAATASRWADIASVEVRTADGRTVLKLTS